jgi:hypothetical protein
MKDDVETKVAQHEVIIMDMHSRLEKIDDKVSEVREKLFDGYDIKITNTNDKVFEIIESIRRLEAMGGIDQNQVENMICRKLEAHISDEKQDKQWFKTHRVELLSLFTASCMIALVVMTYIGS